MFWRHECSKLSGWSSFNFDNCDGCITAAVTTESLTVEKCAQIRTTLRALHQLPTSGALLVASPEDLAHVKELYQTGQSMLLSWTHKAHLEIAAALQLDTDSDTVKSIDRIVRRAVANALSNGG